MEAVPRLPMISFELKTSTETASFSQPLKQYIAQFYGEDPESYNNEIHNLESLRGGAVRPTTDVEGIQLLKKYYCQLHFLKSRFPMEEQQPAAVYFSWKDNYSTLACSIPDIRFELMCILYNIGALHTQLGAMDQRTTPDGMKVACTHFQCAAWAFQILKRNYFQMVSYISSVEIINVMELVCLAQAQECILEKSMMDNRKATIIAKVAVQVVDFYRRAQLSLQGGMDENNYSDYVQMAVFTEWVKYLSFKVTYHKCISLLYQGQQAEEQQKMGERVALYQAAAEELEAARKLSNGLRNKQEISEALAFTSDVVEGKKKAAKNENDFIYHEEIPNKNTFQELKGASLVKGIPFNINDPEVSGPDIFARLVPMEAHEASSLYSEKKAEVSRKYGEIIENKDQKLTEFMSSLQIEFLSDFRQATGIPQDIVDRAAALSARPNAIQDLVTSMTKLSNSYHEVESLLNEIQELLMEEDQHEKEYQKIVGDRPPSIIATDLSREAAKYREAHTKANDSNQNLHRAMVTHVGNLKTLSQPLTQLQQQLPSVKMPDPNIDDYALKEIEMLLNKVEEMKTQRGILWAQLRDALHKDDITNVLVTKQENQTVDDVFKQELEKHDKLTSLIEQNTAAQENIIKAFIDAYAKFANTRRYLQGIITKRHSTINSLISSYDTYEDLLAKATKGVEFYTKLETNVMKLLQRIRSSCKVQQEEREQVLAKFPVQKPTEPTISESNTPKLKDYLDSMKKNRAPPAAPISQAGYAANVSSDGQVWPPGVRPTPVGSEINDAASFPYDSSAQTSSHLDGYAAQNKNAYEKYSYGRNLQEASVVSQYGADAYQQPTVYPSSADVENSLEKRLGALSVSNTSGTSSSPYQQKFNSSEYSGYNYPGYYNYGSGSDNQTGSNVVAGSNTPMGYATGNQQIPQGYSSDNAHLPAAYAAGNQQLQHGFSGNNSQLQSGYESSNTSQLGYSNLNPQLQAGYAPTFNTMSQQQVGFTTGNQPLTTGFSSGNPPSQAGYTPGIPQQTGYTPGIPQQTGYTPENLSQTGYDKQAGYTNPGSTYAAQYSQYIPTHYQQVNYTTAAQASNNVYASGYATSQNLQNSGMATVQSTGYTNYGTPGLFQTDKTSTSYGNSYAVTGKEVQSDIGQSANQSTYPYGIAAYQTTNPPYQSPQIPGSSNAGTANYDYTGGTSGQNFINQPQPAYVSPFPQGALPSQSQYSEGYVGAGSLIGQNQIAASSMYTQAGMNYAHNTNNTSSINGGVTSPQCGQNQANNYAYIPNSESNKNVTSEPQSKESSTMDLLAGLEFSISQVPLQPEQKKIEPSPKKDVVPDQKPVAAISEQKADPKPPSTAVKPVEKVIFSKPLDNDGVKNLFQYEIDKYEKFVEVLSNKTLNGPTTLDLKWKDIQDNQESEGAKKIISVARCYPMKNRFPDILPYDHSRLILDSATDDYINASYIKDISPFVPPVIVTQAPLQATIQDFWIMILEQRVEFIMCLLSDSEIGSDIYWPLERGKDISFANMVVSLQSSITKKYWTERLITISIPEKREFSTIVHLQFTDWPGSLFPVSPDPFVLYVREFITLYQQQRLHSNPMVIHCSSGIGRSGVACLMVFAILEAANNALTMPDLISLTNKITSFRKNILRDREHLKFAYQSFLAYMKQIVSDKGNPTKCIDSSLKEDSSSASSTKMDPLSSLDPFWASRREKK